MKKRNLGVVLALIAIICSVFYWPWNANSNALAAKKSYYIGYSLPTTQGAFMSMITDGVKQKFVDGGYKIDTASADNSPTKQLEQIENFIAMGVDELIVMALDPSSLTDVLKKAQAKGIKVVAYSMETQTYDLFLGVDEGEVGKQLSVMTAEWIDKTFPKAAPGSIEVAILEYRGTAEASRRSDGMREIAKLTPKAKLVKVVGVDTTPTGGQAAAENLLLTNKNVKAVICYNSDTAAGVNSYAMSLNSTVKDKSKFAIFGCDYNEQAVALIKQSRQNKSVFRGVIRMGTSLEALYKFVYDYSLAALDGTLQGKRHTLKLYEITDSNVDNADKMK
jgi:ribose transport system substrate-binding protein